MASVTPGWYPDPWIPQMKRWWDGHGWTHETLPARETELIPAQRAHRWPAAWR
ncbi:MAG: DUF2510 domain-containing protein [Candidatus Nanopelagicales bacterium]